MYKFSKNRSNVAASILQNVEVLKSAYEASSTQFQGSAQQELDKYLDSITAKLQQFTNEVHEFWTGLIDSDVVKFFVELGTQLLNLVNNAGQLRVAITGLAAILTTKKLGRCKMFHHINDVSIIMQHIINLNQNMPTLISFSWEP